MWTRFVPGSSHAGSRLHPPRPFSKMHPSCGNPPFELSRANLQTIPELDPNTKRTLPTLRSHPHRHLRHQTDWLPPINPTDKDWPRSINPIASTSRCTIPFPSKVCVYVCAGSIYGAYSCDIRARQTPKIQSKVR
jgi:hypothetical protein